MPCVLVGFYGTVSLNSGFVAYPNTKIETVVQALSSSG